jgi:hypothetical protein
VSDPTKRHQRNIRIDPQLWAFVQSKAKDGNCSAIIRGWILDKIEDEGWEPKEENHVQQTAR